VTSTAAVLFQRFFARRSILGFDRFEVAAACLLIATKMTDFCIPVAPDELVPALLARTGAPPAGAGAVAGAAQPSAPAQSGGGGGAPRRTEAEVLTKERMLHAERAVLAALEFDVGVEPPPSEALDALLVELAPPTAVVGSSGEGGGSEGAASSAFALLEAAASKALWDALKTPEGCLAVDPPTLARAVVAFAHATLQRSADTAMAAAAAAGEGAPAPPRALAT
jgi:hypothetical protein